MKRAETNKAVKLLSEGHSQRYVAKAVNSSAATINRLKNSDEIKAILDDITFRQIAEIAPKTVELQAKTVNKAIECIDKPDPDQNDIRLVSEGNKVGMFVQGNVGIAGTPAGLPANIQQLNVYNTQNNVVLTQEAIKMLGNQGITSLPDGIVINQELTDEE